MRIGIDVDDTLTNTKELQIKYWVEFYHNYPNSNYTEQIPDTINNFGDEYVQKFWDQYRMKLNFECSVKEGASYYTKKLKEDNHTLCIITSRPDNKYNEDLHILMQNWLDKNNITIDIIYTNIRNKGLFCKENNIDILIDDDINQINNANENNIKSILFNENEKYNGLKAANWEKVYEIICKLKEE